MPGKNLLFYGDNLEVLSGCRAPLLTVAVRGKIDDQRDVIE